MTSTLTYTGPPTYTYTRDGIEIVAVQTDPPITSGFPAKWSVTIDGETFAVRVMEDKMLDFVRAIGDLGLKAEPKQGLKVDKSITILGKEHQDREWLRVCDIGSRYHHRYRNGHWEYRCIEGVYPDLEFHRQDETPGTGLKSVFTEWIPAKVNTLVGQEDSGKRWRQDHSGYHFWYKNGAWYIKGCSGEPYVCGWAENLVSGFTEDYS